MSLPIEMPMSASQIHEIACRKQSVIDVLQIDGIDPQTMLDPIAGLRDSLGEVQRRLADLDAQLVQLEGGVRGRLSSN